VCGRNGLSVPRVWGLNNDGIFFLFPLTLSVCVAVASGTQHLSLRANTWLCIGSGEVACVCVWECVWLTSIIKYCGLSFFPFIVVIIFYRCCSILLFLLLYWYLHVQYKQGRAVLSVCLEMYKYNRKSVIQTRWDWGLFG